MLNHHIVNVDTDSVLICKHDQSEWTLEEQNLFLQELNAQFPENIKWEHDGYFTKVLVLASKNYILDDGKKVKIKGSALKDQKKEKALIQFTKDMVSLLMAEASQDELTRKYEEYIKKCFNLKDISDWTKKLTITDKVLNPERSNEQKVLDAVGTRSVQEGDKIYVFYKKDKSLCLLEDFTGEYDEMKLVARLYDTLEIFSNVLDTSRFIKYALKKNRPLLEKLLNDESSKTQGLSDGEAGNEGHTNDLGKDRSVPKGFKLASSLQRRSYGNGGVSGSSHVSKASSEDSNSNLRKGI